MKILQVNDFRQFETKKVQAFMTYEVENLGFNWDLIFIPRKNRSHPTLNTITIPSPNYKIIYN
jgi:hypothetical protein